MAGNWTPIEDVRSRPVLNLVYDGGTMSWIRQTQAGAGGGGTEYTEGDVDASITGTAILWEDAGNTLRAVSAANPLPVNVVGAGAADTAARTQVADSAADVQLLAANAARLGASIQNDSSAVLFVGLGAAAATSTNYTVRLVQNAYYEVPFNYTGEIRGIWASDPNDGAARITEIT